MSEMFVNGVAYRSMLMYPPGALEEMEILVRMYPVGQEVVTGEKRKEVSYRGCCVECGSDTEAVECGWWQWWDV